VDEQTNRQWVVRCCYLGMFIQAMVINLAPLLFIPLKDQLGLTFEQVGRLILINFMTQLAADLFCTVLADRVSSKLLTVLANVTASLGLVWFSIGSLSSHHAYLHLLVGTVIFSVGCGLLEVLLSPIINAVPSERKAGDMALLHACYPIGKVVVILITGITLHLVGAEHWRAIMLGWALVPVLNTVGFLLVQLPALAEPGRRQGLRELMGIPSYVIAVIALGFAGATEVTLAQWTSAFAERGLGFSKIVADVVGFGLFGLGMMAGRLWFGFKGEGHHLHRWLQLGSWGSALICLVISLSPWPVVSLGAGLFAGLFVSMLWPGVVSLTAARFPLAGASMFALLAAGGDAGAGLMPWLLGVLTDQAARLPASWINLFGHPLTAEQFGLRCGILVTSFCPILLSLLLVRFHRYTPR
jgi:fucose permease